MSNDDYFEKSYHVDRYHALEEDLLKFLDYMPLELYNTPSERERIKSTYLADLLLRIGSNIDVLFKKLILSKYAAKIKGDPDSWNWGTYKMLESECGVILSNKFITLISTSEKIYPFKGQINSCLSSWVDITTKDTEYWWNCYNKVKHEGMLEKANLENVIQALGAFFLLIIEDNRRTETTKKLIQYGYLIVSDPYAKKKLLMGEMGQLRNILITKLFIYPGLS